MAGTARRGNSLPQGALDYFDHTTTVKPSMADQGVFLELPTQSDRDRPLRRAPGAALCRTARCPRAGWPRRRHCGQVGLRVVGGVADGQEPRKNAGRGCSQRSQERHRFPGSAFRSLAILRSGTRTMLSVDRWHREAGSHNCRPAVSRSSPGPVSVPTGTLLRHAGASEHSGS